MKSFWAIVKLTFKNGMRSHIFQLLLFVLLLATFGIPMVVTGDGTAGGFIRVSLLYSLSVVGWILSLSSIWVACFVMASDIDNYQLHMVVTKPVSRIRIWLAKWTGVCLLHLILLVISSLVIYVLIMYKYGKQDFPPEEKTKIQNEVMVGRRVFLPEKPDFGTIAREAVKDKIKRITERGNTVDDSMEGQGKMYDEAMKEVVSQYSECKPGVPRMWQFKNLPQDLDRPMFLRYRPYVDKVATEGQRMTRGLWNVGIAKDTKETSANTNVFEQAKSPGYELFFYPMSENPEQVMSGEFHEKVILPEWKVVTPERDVMVAYVNYDDSGVTQYFQPKDGPKLLIRVCGFLENYLRAVTVVALQLVILAGLGCAFAGFLTLPTAIFVVCSYLLFGSFAVYMVGLEYMSGAGDYIANFIAKLLLYVVIPLQAFEVTRWVANGEIIEFSIMWQIFFHYFLLRALPLFVLGVIFYRRRELGLVIRK